MRKKIQTKENYLDKIPQKADIKFSENSDGLVTLEIENKGLANKIAQMILKKPKVSYIHLDEFGSFVWKRIDGKKNVYDIGKRVEENFGEKANPLYERLAKFVQILKSYNFINFK